MPRYFPINIPFKFATSSLSIFFFFLSLFKIILPLASKESRIHSFSAIQSFSLGFSLASCLDARPQTTEYSDAMPPLPRRFMTPL